MFGPKPAIIRTAAARVDGNARRVMRQRRSRHGNARGVTPIARRVTPTLAERRQRRPASRQASGPRDASRRLHRGNARGVMAMPMTSRQCPSVPQQYLHQNNARRVTPTSVALRQRERDHGGIFCMSPFSFDTPGPAVDAMDPSVSEFQRTATRWGDGSTDRLKRS